MALPTSFHRRLLPLYQGLSRRLHELDYLFVELTHRCNLRCLHCGSDCTCAPDAPDLPAEDILRVLTDIAEEYDASKITVVLSGGEPLVYPGVFELGARIGDLGFGWGMVTNGFAWTPQQVRAARRAGMHYVTVSLDGLEESHNWLRGHPRSFERACAAIRTLVDDSGCRVLDVITCVNQRNLAQLDAIHDRLVELGVRRWRLFTIAPIGRATLEPDLFLDREGYHGLMRSILRFRASSELTVNFCESDYLGPRLERQVRHHDYFCTAGVRVGGIMVNGDILACPNIDRRFRQGNIHHDDFVDVWEHRFTEFRDRRWTRVGPCADCHEWSLCQGNSLHLWDRDAHQPRLCTFREYDLGSFELDPG